MSERQGTETTELREVWSAIKMWVDLNRYEDSLSYSHCDNGKRFVADDMKVGIFELVDRISF